MRLQFAMVIALALALGVQPLPAAAGETARPTVIAIVRSSPLEALLTSYCAAMRQMVAETDLSRDRVFIHHWQASSDAAFASQRLDSGVIAQIDAALTDSDIERVRALFAMPLIGRAVHLERASTELDPDRTRAAVAEGTGLLAAMTEQRRRLLDAVLASGPAELDRRLIRQALRMMLVGLSLAAQHGRVEISWAEVDAQASATAPILAGQQADETRALAAYTYRSLSDADLLAYAQVLDTPPMQRFQTISTLAVEAVVERAVFSFGTRMAERMRSVGI